jgi:chaperonin GroES
MKFVPCHDNILVERDTPEEKKSPGGVLLPKSAQDRPDTGVVLSVGPGRSVGSDGVIVRPAVAVGDRVSFGSYAGTEVIWGDETHLVVPWSDILGIIEDD